MATERYGAQDLQPMLTEFGVPVSRIVGGVETVTCGILDTTDEDLLTGEAAGFAGKVNVVVVETGTVPELAEGVTVYVDGVEHTVLSTRQQDDGALTRVWVRE